MGKTSKKYPVEKALEDFFVAARKYLFEKRKNKVDQITHTMELLAWLLLTISLILRIGNM